MVITKNTNIYNQKIILLIAFVRSVGYILYMCLGINNWVYFSPKAIV